MSSQTQKSFFITAVNGEPVIQDRARPTLLPGDVIVKNLATALNPIDAKMHQHGLYVDVYPKILGFDAAGTIEAIGTDVAQWKVGDRVLYQGFFRQDRQTFQHYTSVPADVVAKLPDNVTFEEGSTVPTCLLTAAAGLYEYKGLDDVPSFTPPWLPGGEGKYAGRPIVVLGGSSSVGQYAIQLARLSGFSPIITTASPRNEHLVKSLGATHFVNRSSPTLVADVLSLFSSLSLDKSSIVFDAIAEKSTQEIGLEVLAPNGVLVLVLPSQLDAEKVKQEEKHVYQVIGVGQRPQLRDFAHVVFAVLPDLLQTGRIKPNAYEILPKGLHGIEAGLKDLSENKVSGKKLVARPFDTE